MCAFMLLASVQLKGGSGKTTSVLGLALAALRAGVPSVTVVDLDPQRSATTWIQRYELPIDILNQLPRKRQKNVTYLCDTPGLDAVTTSDALKVADKILVPLRASLLDFDAALRMVRAVTGVGKEAAWLPSQIDLRRAADRNLGHSLEDAMKKGVVPRWPILPHIRSLSGIEGYLRGLGLLEGTEDTRESTLAANDFAAVWRALN